MDSRRLGDTGPITSCLGFGCLALSGVYGEVTRSESLALLHNVLDTGVTLLDMSDNHANGEVERLVGEAVRPWRDDVLLSTRTLQRRSGNVQLRQACEASLERLGVDYVDLYIVGREPDAVPVEETAGRLGELVAAGKVRYAGLAGVTGDELRRAHAVHPITTLAMEYSLWHRDAELDQLPVARELGIGLIAGRPLGRGFLAGRGGSARELDPGDARLTDPRFDPANLPGNIARLRKLEAEAATMDVSTGRLALAWLLARGPDVVPVPSTRDPVHLEMNAGSVRLLLTDATCRRLEAAFPHGAAAGARLPG
ncbi:aldo/keto reductase [Nonomuraea deserti]|uniref:aldo/keto reductase n=1 Tax=Nonomuraea deserti TaxID=1848322 RepID=UPI0014046C4E|nr:aldo/keto reductase [Nonomuraea deserti]